MAISFRSPFPRKIISPVGEPFKIRPKITVDPKKIWQGAKDLFKPKPLPEGWSKTDRGYSFKFDRPSKPMVTPTKMPTPTPTRTPIRVIDRTTPTMPTMPTQKPMAKPTPIPSNIKELDYKERPYHKEIVNAWGDKANTAHDILRYVNEEGVVKGENVDYMARDIANRINPKTGKWDSNAPIMTFTNPFTREKENSVDRGLFRINNKTFYDYQRRFPDILRKNNIREWDDMLDPAKNSIMAKIIYNIQKEAWYAAKPSTGARLE